MECHKKVENFDDNELDTVWRDHVNNGSMLITLEMLWTRWPNFKNCGMNALAE